MIDVNNDIVIKKIYAIRSVADFILENTIQLYHCSKLYGAFYQNQIIGIVSFVDHMECVEMSSIYILGLFRGVGIGSKLLNVAITNMDKKVIIRYNSLNVDIVRFNSFLTKNYWINLNYEFSTYRIDRLKIKDNQIVHRWVMDVKLADSITCIDMSSMDNNRLMNTCMMATKLTHEKYLQPISNFNRIIPKLSFFLFDCDKLVAWITTEIHCKDEIYLKCLFVHESYRKLKLGLVLWQKVLIALSKNNEFDGIKYCSFCFDKNNNRLHRTYNTIWGSCICLKYESFYAERK